MDQVSKQQPCACVILCAKLLERNLNLEALVGCKAYYEIHWKENLESSLQNLPRNSSDMKLWDHEVTSF